MKNQSTFALTALIVGITTSAEGLSRPLAKDFSLQQQQQHYFQLDTQTVMKDELTTTRQRGLAVSVDRTWQARVFFTTGLTLRSPDLSAANMNFLIN